MARFFYRGFGCRRATTSHSIERWSIDRNQRHCAVALRHLAQKHQQLNHQEFYSQAMIPRHLLSRRAYSSLFRATGNIRSTNLLYASDEGCNPSEATNAGVSSPCWVISVM